MSLTAERKAALVAAGLVRYEVTFPDGRVERMSRDALHVDLKARDEALYERVTFRPIYDEPLDWGFA